MVCVKERVAPGIVSRTSADGAIGNGKYSKGKLINAECTRYELKSISVVSLGLYWSAAAKMSVSTSRLGERMLKVQ